MLRAVAVEGPCSNEVNRTGKTFVELFVRANVSGPITQRSSQRRNSEDVCPNADKSGLWLWGGVHVG